ncbi:MAG: serine hydrolase [Propionibacteriales bacterium]|nr:serine hydrolase [Propionibacteriales bacterium]
MRLPRSLRDTTRRSGVGRLTVLAVVVILLAGMDVPDPEARAQADPRPADLDARRLLEAATSEDGPLLGWPSLPELATDRADILLDPDYWTNYVREVLVDGTVVLPLPIDVVKPETALPTARVADGRYVSALPRRHLDLLGVSYDWRGRAKTVDDFLRTTETDGLAFVHDGELVGEHYTNGWSAGLRHQPWSVTKSFTSTLVGIAIDEGLVVSVDNPIDSYIPMLRGTVWEGVTIENLLQMESGVHWDESTPVLAQNTQVLQWVGMALDLYTDGALGKTRNEFLMSLPRVAPQGTEFSYNSGNTQVLSWLLESVYGRPFNEILSAKLWQPAGMAGDAKVMTDRVGDAVASQGLYARMRDFARFGELFRRGGRTPDGTRVVTGRWVRRATTFTEVSDGRYGYQWWRGATPDSYTAVGFQGQFIEVSQANCLTGVRLAHTLGGDLRPNGDDPLDPAGYGFEVEAGEREWNAVYRAVAAHLGGCRG